MTTRVHSIRDLFCSSIELPVPERSGFLRSVRCDTSLKEEVRALLAHHEAPAPALRTSAPAPGVEGQMPAAAGFRLGRYRLIERLGEGGMGTVFKAEQERPRRIVAVKVLRTAFASEEARDRLIREAEALGRLGHPGIAQIYEAGCVSTDCGPQPFIAMEYIDGQPLTLFAQERRLGMRDRLSMFIRVCEAVQHAHDRGVIHRDLTPGNIIVTGAGQPKVLDFGIAVCMEAGAHVESGGLVGTIAYMSPEQARGDPRAVDGRTDVYSLGVLLFELLTGRLPLDVAHMPLSEAARTIREAEPCRLKRASGSFCDDLQAIVATALNKEPQSRYASPAEFAADVRRFLEHRPVAARRAGPVHRAARFSRRHRLGVSVLALVVLSLCAGVLISLREAARADRRARQANVMVLAFREAIVGPRWGAWRGADVRVSERLVDIRRHLSGQFGGQPELEALAEASLGRGFLNVYQLNNAEAALRRALSLWSSGPRENVLAFLAAKCDLGETLFCQGRFAEAEGVFREVVSDRACRRDPVVFVDGLEGLATALHGQNRPSDALPIFEAAQGAARKHFADDHPLSIIVRMDAAMTLGALGRSNEAEDLLEHNDAMLRTMGPDMCAVLCENSLRLGALLLRRGESERASQLFDEALSVQRTRAGTGSVWTVVALLFRAGQTWTEGDLGRTEAMLREAVDLGRRLLPPLDANLASAVNSLGVCLRDQGRTEEAERLLFEAMEIRRRASGPDNRDVGASAINLAGLMMREERLLEAFLLASESLRVRRQQTNRCEPEIIESYAVLGRIECSLGMPASGLALIAMGVEGRSEGGHRADWRTDVAVEAAAGVFEAMTCGTAARELLRVDYQKLAESVGASNAATERAHRRLERFDRRVGASNPPVRGCCAGSR